MFPSSMLPVGWKEAQTVLKCMVDGFQKATLLRVQEDSLVWCDGEERSVEGRDVFFQIMSMSDVDLDR